MLNGAAFKKLGLAAALTGCMLVGSAVPALAYDHDWRDREKCEKRIGRAEDKLHREVYRHGEYSRQAEHARHELRETREQCRWIDGQQWRDHDRDRDRR